MDRLQIAQDRYAQLSLALPRGDDGRVSDQVEAWLRDDVCAVVHNLLANEQFKRLARWSPDHLARGVTTTQRNLVEAVDRAIVQCATQLVAAARYDKATESATEMSQPEVDVSSPSAVPAPTITTGAAFGQGDLTVIEWIASRPWWDLVCVEEYCHPNNHLLLEKSDPYYLAEYRQKYELRVPLGDYVARSMFARINYYARQLLKCFDRVFCALGGRRPLEHHLAEGLFSARIRLDESIRRLQEACCSEGRTRLRDAAVALTLVYAAYHPCPELDWLHYPPGWGTASAGLIRSCIRPPGEVVTVAPSPTGRFQILNRTKMSLCLPESVRGIGAALDDIVRFYRRPVETEDLIAWTCNIRRLVMVDRPPRCVFWDGQPIEAKWEASAKEWELLWHLAQRVTKPVDRTHLSNPTAVRAIVTRRQRLGILLPRDLDDLIKAAPTRAYQLMLPAEDVGLLQINNEDQLIDVSVEVLAGTNRQPGDSPSLALSARIAPPEAIARALLEEE